MPAALAPFPCMADTLPEFRVDIRGDESRAATPCIVIAVSDRSVLTRHDVVNIETPADIDPVPSLPERSRDSWHRHKVWLLPLLVAVLLGQMAVGMITSAREQSPVIDEVVYVGAAVVYTTRHDLQINPEHPPLGKLLSAVGLSFTEVRLDPTYQGSQMQVGRRVLYREGNDADQVLLLARLPMIILTLLFGLVVFAFGRDLAGSAGGLVGLGLYAFSPDVIAHGSLATNDVPMAGFLLTSAWLLWRARRRPWRYLPLAALAFGCAMATKMTALVILPVFVLLAGLSVWHAGRGAEPVLVRRRVLSIAGAMALFGVLAIATVWVTYLIVDPRLRFTTPPNAARLDGLMGLAVHLLPLPAPYRDGLAVQVTMEHRLSGATLFGRHYDTCPWFYLPAAVLVKTPLGMLVLWLAGFVTVLAVRRLRPAGLYVLLPIALLMLVSMGGDRGFGIRYVIWLPLFLAVAAAATAVYRRRPRWVLPAVLLLVALTGTSSLRTFPYYLPYSNEAFGGPSQTYRHLADANVDWGQDLRRLGIYLNEQWPGEPVWLIYKGRGDPKYYGIEARDPLKVPPEKVHGLLAVSATRIDFRKARYRALVGGRTPIAIIGHSIHVYRLP
jgi:hypothetical protein